MELPTSSSRAENTSSVPSHDRTPEVPLTLMNIIIVGAGIGGLALASLLGRSGHRVTILEAAHEIAEVGAGLTCSPNLTRLLKRWGFEGRIREHADLLTRIDLRRWEEGLLLGSAPLSPLVEQNHGSPQYVLHRADIHSVLLEAAKEVAQLRVNAMVTSIDFQAPSVSLSDGTTIEADLVVGADGMKSTCRKLIYDKIGQIDRAVPTGDAAFRACLPLARVTDPELRKFVTTPVATRWMGQGAHIQAYPIRHGNLYNMVMCHPDVGFTEESWTAQASKQKIIDTYGDWDPEILRKLIDLIPDENVLEWRLCQHDPLPTWMYGKVVLLGDACHPMLPYVAQGAAQAIEDAGVLHLAINRVPGPERMGPFLKAYELARKSRAEHIVAIGGMTAEALHLGDGPEQMKRDEQFRAVSSGGKNPDLLGDPEMQKFLWDHDPEQHFLDNLDRLIAEARLMPAELPVRVSNL